MSGERQMEIYKRWKKMNKDKICKKDKEHYVDDWGCVDCMFEGMQKLLWKIEEREEEKNND